MGHSYLKSSSRVFHCNISILLPSSLLILLIHFPAFDIIGPHLLPSMDIQQSFPNVHWIWQGEISFVYEVDPRIVVKVPKPGAFQKRQFDNEVRIHEIFSRHSLCPSVVQCFFYTDNGIFLEYMRGADLKSRKVRLLTTSLDGSLFSRMQKNQTWDQRALIVTKVDKLEPLNLRKAWMNDLAQAVAFLESLNLAHGDLRPENVLLDRDRLKLSDFDCTAEIGADFEACLAPYGRLLKSNEASRGLRGTSGRLGPRTEQFALGSLYYLINYGFEVYGDRSLTSDPREHGPRVVELLQDMEFPELDGDTPEINDIITKCWHNKYATIAELAAHTVLLPSEGASCETTTDEGANRTKDDDNSIEVLSLDRSGEDFSSKKAICQDLASRGLLGVLSSGEPEQLGFPWEWYRQAAGEV